MGGQPARNVPERLFQTIMNFASGSRDLHRRGEGDTVLVVFPVADTFSVSVYLIVQSR